MIETNTERPVSLADRDSSCEEFDMGKTQN